jgi:hypothetical protein
MYGVYVERMLSCYGVCMEETGSCTGESFEKTVKAHIIALKSV